MQHGEIFFGGGRHHGLGRIKVNGGCTGDRLAGHFLGNDRRVDYILLRFFLRHLPSLLLERGLLAVLHFGLLHGLDLGLILALQARSRLLFFRLLGRGLGFVLGALLVPPRRHSILLLARSQLPRRAFLLLFPLTIRGGLFFL
jgi:hypothetical protein